MSLEEQNKVKKRYDEAVEGKNGLVNKDPADEATKGFVRRATSSDGRKSRARP